MAAPYLVTYEVKDAITAKRVDMEALAAVQRLGVDASVSKSKYEMALIVFSVQEFRKHSPFFKGNRQQVADWNPNGGYTNHVVIRKDLIIKEAQGTVRGQYTLTPKEFFDGCSKVLEVRLPDGLFVNVKVIQAGFLAGLAFKSDKAKNQAITYKTLRAKALVALYLEEAGLHKDDLLECVGTPILQADGDQRTRLDTILMDYHRADCDVTRAGVESRLRAFLDGFRAMSQDLSLKRQMVAEEEAGKRMRQEDYLARQVAHEEEHARKVKSFQKKIAIQEELRFSHKTYNIYLKDVSTRKPLYYGRLRHYSGQADGGLNSLLEVHWASREDFQRSVDQSAMPSMKLQYDYGQGELDRARGEEEAAKLMKIFMKGDDENRVAYVWRSKDKKEVAFLVRDESGDTATGVLSVYKCVLQTSNKDH